MRVNILILLLLGLVGYAVPFWLDSIKPAQPPVSVTESPTPEIKAPAIGQPAPGFTFTDLHGKSHDIADFKGKTVLLNFWASWCPPCIEEFPRLLDIAARHADQVVLIALSSDVDDRTITRFLRQHHVAPDHVNVIFARDSENITGELFRTFQLPETFIIDPSLVIRAKFIGADWDMADLESLITATDE